MKILLAVDGSDQSYEAVQAVGTLTAAELLIVLHVLSLPRLSYPTVGPNLDKELSLRVEQGMKEEGERLLDRVASLLPPHHGITSKRLETGSPADVVLNVAEEEQADLIVVGARGLGQIREHLFGSVSHRIMTHATCATLVVKSPVRHVQHILLPVENQEDTEGTIGFLSKKPFRENPRFTVMHVVPFSEPVWPVGVIIPDSFREEMMAHAEELTNDVVSRLEELGYTANGMAVMGAPSVSILEEASARNPDLILMRSQNRTGVSRFLLGSVSHSVIHDTPSSLLLVR